MASAWDEVRTQIDGSPYEVLVLPTDPERAKACLATLEVTTASWLGAVVTNTGGILVDHGWLRVLGSGSGGLSDILIDADPVDGWLTVAYDVLGGQFAWVAHTAGSPPTIHYFAPDDLAWLDLEVGYRDWLYGMLGGAVAQFYENLRWPGWEAEVAAVRPDQGISTYPPAWSVEGKDPA